MADALFCVGFSKACKQAREGGGLPGYEPSRSSRGRCLRRFLPPDLVRLIDALVRRLEHEDTLLRMNRGELDLTLCEAAAAGGLLNVRFLLARGADLETTIEYIDEAGNRDWGTALVCSAFFGHLAVCRELLDAGAELPEDAMLVASTAGRTHIVALLLDHGADVHYLNDICLFMAADGHLETVRLLLDRGANILAAGAALRVASERGLNDIVSLLLDAGADVNGDADQPSLGAAANHGRLETVRLLLDRGADVHAHNDLALYTARQAGHADVVALLLERGAVDV